MCSILPNQLRGDSEDGLCLGSDDTPTPHIWISSFSFAPNVEIGWASMSRARDGLNAYRIAQAFADGVSR